MFLHLLFVLLKELHLEFPGGTPLVRDVHTRWSIPLRQAATDSAKRLILLRQYVKVIVFWRVINQLLKDFLRTIVFSEWLVEDLG